MGTGLLWAVVVGVVVGVIAKFIVHGRTHSVGFIWTILIGIAGSLLATWIGQTVGWYQPGQSAGWIASIGGAVVLILIYGAIRRRSGGLD
jgi:uncharacterized membrane protein YeaQ/YmgE (transglycosylase-associated protein family)